MGLPLVRPSLLRLVPGPRLQETLVWCDGQFFLREDVPLGLCRLRPSLIHLVPGARLQETLVWCGFQIFQLQSELVF